MSRKSPGLLTDHVLGKDDDVATGPALILDVHHPVDQEDITRRLSSMRARALNGRVGHDSPGSCDAIA